MKLLRKSRGKWIAIASGIGIVTSMMMTDYVSAEAEQPTANESQPFSVSESLTEEPVEVASEAVESVKPVEIAPANEATIVAEQQAAVSEITATWQANTIQSIQQEIERQEALRLPEYVIQWGDTLSTIAVASNTTVDELVTINQIANRDLIITGQLLKGVLNHQNTMDLVASDPDLLERERQASYKKITSSWTANSDSEIQREIMRQEQLQLSEYVIQWGDTLGAIARVSGTSITELATLNNIRNIDLIITGNTLKGVWKDKEAKKDLVPPSVMPQPPVEPTPTPEEHQPPVEPTPTPEEHQPPVEPTPTPEEHQPPVEPTPTPEEHQPPVEPTPTPEEHQPPVEPTPTPEEHQPPVEPAPTPEEYQPPVEPTPTPEEHQPPVEPTPTPEEHQPPVEPTPTPEEHQPPVEPTPTPEEHQPPVEPTPTPEEEQPPVVEIAKPAPEVSDKPIYTVEIRMEERRQSLEFEIEEIVDVNLPEGTIEETEGQVGEIIRTFEIAQGEDGTILSEKEVNLQRIAPVNKIIRRGAIVDRSRLEAAINHATSHESARYTNATWMNLNAVLGESKTVYNTRAITQQQATDAAINLEAAIERLQLLKAKPILTLANVEPNELQGLARVSYQLEDRDAAHIRSEVKVYRDGQLVTTQALDQLQAVLTQLDLDTHYEVESTLVYDRGNGEESEVSQTRTPVELQLKRIELKDIQDVALMKHTNGHLSRILNLTGQEDASQYVARIKTSNTKEMLLPVTSFQKEGDKVKVNVQLPQLVQREDQRTFRENFAFQVASVETVSPTLDNGRQLITSFANLITAITANPTGHFVLGADVSASEVNDPDKPVYITETFSGSLTAFFQGKQYSIYDLAKPLFNEIHTATVSQLQLKEVNIKNNDTKAAALAINMRETRLQDVTVEGTVSARHHVAGIVNEVRSNSRLENVAFKGELYATTPTSGAMNIGGIVSLLHNSSLNKAAADVTITLTANNGNNRAGGLVGHADHGNTLISNSYAKGILRNIGTGGQVGGAVGSTWQSARVDNVLSLMNVTNGYTFYGDANYRNANVRNAYIAEGISTGKESLFAQTISTNDAQARIQAYDVSSTMKWTQPTGSFDYSAVQGAQANRTVAYRNTEKLLPFYNREYIVKQGNKISSASKLATTELVSLVPMHDNRFITNYYTDKTVINRLLMHFADGTVEYADLTSGTRYKDSSVYDYQLVGTDLIYTPDQFIHNPTPTFNALVEEFKQMNYMEVVTSLFPDYTYPFSIIVSQKEQMPNKLNTTTEEAVAKLKADGVDPFYLEAAFKHVQNNIQHYLNSLLAQQLISASTETNAAGMDYLIETIRANKEQIIMSLSYIDRLYSIDFDGKNIGDLSLFRQDFLGKKVDLLDWLVQLGNSGKDTFNIERNYNTYGAHIGRINGKETLHDYLDAYRTRLTNKTASEWLKSATKAYLVEKPSQEPGLENVPTDVYDALTRPRHRALLLPLLTLSGEGIYIIRTMTSLSLGMYDRYMDMNLAQTNPALYQQKVAEVKAAADLEGERQRRFFDMWYRLANDNVKQTLLTRRDVPIPTWDGYRLSDNRGWAPAFGERAGNRVLEFFGPIGKWYRHNGLGAYAVGDYTHFVHDQALTQYGNSVFTHEMTHNMDGSTFLGGYNRRKSAGAETYALGMLQSVTTATNQIFGWNMTLDHATNNGGKNLTDRVHNLNPERFQNQDDLQAYFKGVFDVIYTLDAIEGEAFLKGTEAQKRSLFKTLTLEKDANGEGTDRIRAFTDEEWEQLNLTTLADLVNNDVILGLHSNYSDRKVGRDSYQTILMFVPIYGAITNDTGIAGNITFKRLTFDILAEKGYEGMLGYTSNKYLNEATREGAVFSDKYVVQKLFDGKYADFKEFKLDMLTRRLEAAKAGQLREIEFTYEGRTYTTSYENIKNLIEQTAKRSPAQVQRVKEAIYRAYLLDTNDFRDSIYKAQP